MNPMPSSIYPFKTSPLLSILTMTCTSTECISLHINLHKSFPWALWEPDWQGEHLVIFTLSCFLQCRILFPVFCQLMYGLVCSCFCNVTLSIGTTVRGRQNCKPVVNPHCILFVSQNSPMIINAQVNTILSKLRRNLMETYLVKYQYE